MCKKLQIDPKEITSAKTNLVEGSYVIKISGSRYVIDPKTGDFLDENNQVIVNLFGVDKNIKVDKNVMTKVQDAVVENIKTTPDFTSSEAKFSAKNAIPFFSANKFIDGGLVINNSFYSFDKLGIKKSLDNSVRTFSFVDMNNDGVDELCAQSLVGAGLTGKHAQTEIFTSTDNTLIFKKWDAEKEFQYNEGMKDPEVQFFKCNNKTYTVASDHRQFRILFFKSNQMKKVGIINLSFPTYTCLLYTSDAADE